MTIEQMKADMHSAIDAYKDELATLRTGRAHAGLLDKVTVDYYGSQTPLKQMANITVSDPKTLAVTPWDKGVVGLVVKAIQSSDLGLTAALAGDAIRVPIPLLTEERRKGLVKHLKQEAENTRVGVRNVRRQEINELKSQLKEKMISEDDERRGASEIQKVTDAMIQTIEQITDEKEKELMTV